MKVLLLALIAIVYARRFKESLACIIVTNSCEKDIAFIETYGENGFEESEDTIKVGKKKRFCSNSFLWEFDVGYYVRQSIISSSSKFSEELFDTRIKCVVKKLDSKEYNFNCNSYDNKVKFDKSKHEIVFDKIDTSNIIFK